MDAYIRRDEDGSYVYVEQRRVADGDDGIKEETLTITDPVQIKLITNIVKLQETMDTALATIPCWNPQCNNMVICTKEQKRDFTIRFYKKYGKIMFPFCCEECRDTFLRLMEEKEKNTGEDQE